MAKYLASFSFIFLFTACSFFSDKSKKEINPATNVEVDARDDTNTIFENKTAEKDGENEIDDSYAEYEEVEFDMTGLQEIHFTELWIWEYLNEDRQWKEMRVAREPNLNYWMFSRIESFKETSDNLEWVVAKPNGEYVLGYRKPDENTLNHRLEVQVLKFEEEQYSDFKPTGKFKEFGKIVYNNDWNIFKGEKHEVAYKAQRNPSEFYLGITDIDMRALYHFNNLEDVVQLPINFPIGLSENTIILGEETDFEYYNKKIHYRFKEISPTSYYAYIPEK